MNSEKKDRDLTVTLPEGWSLVKKGQPLRGLSCGVLREPTGFLFPLHQLHLHWKRLFIYFFFIQHI